MGKLTGTRHGDAANTAGHIWPWWDDTDSLKQAADNVRWLREWLEKMTGKTFDVAGVLAFPGYCVIERKLGPVRVANSLQKEPTSPHCWASEPARDCPVRKWPYRRWDTFINMIS